MLRLNLREMSRFRPCCRGKMTLEKKKMEDLGRNWIKLEDLGFLEKN